MGGGLATLMDTQRSTPVQWAKEVGRHLWVQKEKLWLEWLETTREVREARKKNGLGGEDEAGREVEPPHPCLPEQAQLMSPPWTDCTALILCWS